MTAGQAHALAEQEKLEFGNVVHIEARNIMTALNGILERGEIDCPYCHDGMCGRLDLTCPICDGFGDWTPVKATLLTMDGEDVMALYEAAKEIKH